MNRSHETSSNHFPSEDLLYAKGISNPIRFLNCALKADGQKQKTPWGLITPIIDRTRPEGQTSNNTLSLDALLFVCPDGPAIKNRRWMPNIAPFSYSSSLRLDIYTLSPACVYFHWRSVYLGAAPSETLRVFASKFTFYAIILPYYSAAFPWVFYFRRSPFVDQSAPPDRSIDSDAAECKMKLFLYTTHISIHCRYIPRYQRLDRL